MGCRLSIGLRKPSLPLDIPDPFPRSRGNNAHPAEQRDGRMESLVIPIAHTSTRFEDSILSKFHVRNRSQSL